MHKIYALTDPRTGEVRYVGQTTKPKLRTRLNEHVAHARQNKDRRHVHNWIRALLAEDVRPEIVLLEETSDVERERVWLRYYRIKGARLTNAHRGGSRGPLGIEQSDEHRERIAAAHRGKPKRQPGRVNTPEARENMRQAALRRAPPSAEARRRMSDAQSERAAHDREATNLRIKQMLAARGIEWEPPDS